MSETPRLRSAYPSTPASARQRNSPAAPGRDSRSPLPSVPQSTASSSSASGAPVVPITLVDAPSQRLYALALYGLLTVWRLYDWWTVVEAGESSTALFFKWTLIDAIYCFGIPLLRIPWLEWSETASFVATLTHMLGNGALMFRVPLPLEAWLLMFTKTLFSDKEISISENSVRVSNILHNSSLIMGKQIIKVLPEGSATMNPDGLPFCLDHLHHSVNIPLRFNQTVPKHVELLRIDLDSNMNETITLSNKELKRKTFEEDGLLSINYLAKKTGVYRLYKVVDETKLEVQRRMSDTLVLACPQASIKSPASNKCLGDLSDLTIEIHGTPPLKIAYSRVVNSDRSVHHFQNLQPDNFESPLIAAPKVGTLVKPGHQDVSWARARTINVPLNESMLPAGKWLYSIDEIHDAVGNVVKFSTGSDDGEHHYPKGAHLEHGFTIHERPVVKLHGCDSRRPLQVPNGESTQLPSRYRSGGRAGEEGSHVLTWKFSPLESLTPNGDHGDDFVTEEFMAKTLHNVPRIKTPGLYTLVGVKSQYCDGEVEEPSSCLLLNPPEPHLTVSAENINDKCAGNPIGLLVDLDLVGSPPFTIRYDIITKAGIDSEQVKVDGLRSQIELKPKSAGQFKYRFTSIDDAVYKGHSLAGTVQQLTQDVKPPASAFLRKPYSPIDACIEEPVEMNVELAGEKPFTLEYELIHEGKRKKEKVSGIESDIYKITTDSLTKGGEYAIALNSVQDKTGCKIFLKDTVKFNVRRQRPRVAFGHIEGKSKTMEVEGRKVDLPIRLTGQGPWMVKYRKVSESGSKVLEKTVKSTNDKIHVSDSGVYELLEVSDDKCPGTVESKASTFEVQWLSRPEIRFSETAVLLPDGDRYHKREVCEGDIDAVEVSLVGSSPFNVKYQVRHKPERGTGSISNKEFDAALNSATISMDTSKAGVYEYKFTELSDTLYDHNSKKHKPLIFEQRVNQKPVAHFIKPGQSYKYCKEELAGDEIIPIKFDGKPPFSLEVDIKHQSSARPETVKIANIESNRYDFKIPHRVLSLGIHQVSIRKVRDANGCQQKTEYNAPHVQVQVYDVPTIHPLETRTEYCVGERISYTLSGTAPFEIFYTFEDIQRKAKSASTTFRRIAEKAGTFQITAVSDKASECKALTSITKTIHQMPSVKISKGKQVEVDIHEGGEAEILFEFWGTPPFEFTYTRSTNAKRGQKSKVLETRHEVSNEHSMSVRSSLEGTYEVVAIKDKYCSFSTLKEGGGGGGSAQKKYLTY